jgi:hypothetical protein
MTSLSWFLARFFGALLKNIASSWFRQFCLKRHWSYLYFISYYSYSVSLIFHGFFIWRFWRPFSLWILCSTLHFMDPRGMDHRNPLPPPSTVYWDTIWDGWEDAKTEDQMMSNALKPPWYPGDFRWAIWSFYPNHGICSFPALLCLCALPYCTVAGLQRWFRWICTRKTSKTVDVSMVAIAKTCFSPHTS